MIYLFKIILSTFSDIKLYLTMQFDLF